MTREKTTDIDKARRGVIIIGGHVQGLGFLRSFARRGIPTIVINSKRTDIIRFSRYLGEFIQYDYMNNPTGLADLLLNLAREKSLVDWMLLPTNDPAVKALSTHREALGKHYLVTVPGWDSVRYCYEKKQTYLLAEELGIPFPKTIYPGDAAHLEFLAADIEFPVILKPSVMHRFQSVTGKKAIKVADMRELLESYEGLTGIIPPSEIMVQEIIQGAPRNLFSFGALCVSGNPLRYVIARRKRQQPMDFGTGSTFVETIAAGNAENLENGQNTHEIRELSMKLLRRMNYSGLCEVEFIRDEKDGKFKLLEVNPRSWKWIGITELDGRTFFTDLFDSNYTGEDGFSAEETAGQLLSPAKWVHFWQDLYVSLKEMLGGRMDPGEYRKSMKGKKKWAVADRKDPLPFILEPFLYIFGRSLNR